MVDEDTLNAFFEQFPNLRSAMEEPRFDLSACSREKMQKVAALVLGADELKEAADVELFARLGEPGSDWMDALMTWHEAKRQLSQMVDAEIVRVISSEDARRTLS